MTKQNIIRFLVSLALCEGAGIVGGAFTASAIREWYAFLEKPSFSPPNWLFGPVWILLYTLMAISLFLVWQKGLEDKKTKFEKSSACASRHYYFMGDNCRFDLPVFQNQKNIRTFAHSLLAVGFFRRDSKIHSRCGLFEHVYFYASIHFFFLLLSLI